MNKDNGRVTYDEFMMMFNIAPSMCYTLYEKAEDEIENLQKKAELGEHYKHLYSEVKKQKDDVVECLKELSDNTDDTTCYEIDRNSRNDLLRMLGECNE